MTSLLASSAAALLLVAGCAGQQGGPGGEPGHHGERSDPSGMGAQIKQLLRYDANKDGTVTRAEMEAGLRADFDRLDLNHDGRLDAEETRAENARRYKQDGPQYSPLIDWNQDGVIDFKEFASTVRSFFDALDRGNTGVLTPDELHLPPPVPPPPQQQDQRGGGSYPGQ